MIALSSGCLVFQMASGECVPFSAEMVSVELMGDTAQLFDAEFVEHAANAVFHYYKQEMGRQVVTVAEFAESLEKVLRGFELSPAKPAAPAAPAATPAQVAEFDLAGLVAESGAGCELVFFPRLRDELRQRLRQGPRVVRFRGLRPCVKRLVGVSRWSGRCRDLEEQIVQYLRECLSAETKPAELALVVE